MCYIKLDVCFVDFRSFHFYFQHLTNKLNANSAVFVQMQTGFALGQVISGIFFGRLGDLFGEKIALILAFASTAISYSFMAVATSAEVLLISRFFSAFTHVMQGNKIEMCSM